MDDGWQEKEMRTKKLFFEVGGLKLANKNFPSQIRKEHRGVQSPRALLR